MFESLPMVVCVEVKLRIDARKNGVVYVREAVKLIEERKMAREDSICMSLCENDRDADTYCFILMSPDVRESISLPAVLA